MTYSIVARDPETGNLGVAVQTCMFAVGSAVPWVRPGVGAVASQAFGESGYGTWCLDALERGLSATEALARVRTNDPADAMRQLGVVSADGSAASFTGAMCVDEAGDRQGDAYAVQANMMASPKVWSAMADAYESNRGPFVDRLLAALVAAEDAGGDARGAMSAALVVVSGERQVTPGHGVVCDVRVDAAERPLDELARLVRTKTAYACFGRGTDALRDGDGATALRELEAAREVLPDDENIKFAYSGALMLNGRGEEAGQLISALVASRPSWEVVMRGFAAKGLLPSSPDSTT